MRLLHVSALLSASLVLTQAYIPLLPHIESISGSVASLSGIFNDRKPLEQWFEDAKEMGSHGGEVVLKKVIEYHEDVAHLVKDLIRKANEIVSETREIRLQIEEKIDINHLVESLQAGIETAYKELQDEGLDKLPENREQKAEVRAKIVRRVMDKVETAYIHATVTAGFPHEQAEDQFNRLSPKVTHALLIAGNMIDEHPILLEATIFALTMLILPEIQILRPIMSIFGIGPLGPIKGSSAAWCQRVFFGSAVPRGSWFSVLQGVGMTLVGSWIQRFFASLALSALLGLAVTKCSW